MQLLEPAELHPGFCGARDLAHDSAGEGGGGSPARRGAGAGTSAWRPQGGGQRVWGRWPPVGRRPEPAGGGQAEAPVGQAWSVPRCGSRRCQTTAPPPYPVLTGTAHTPSAQAGAQAPPRGVAAPGHSTVWALGQELGPFPPAPGKAGKVFWFFPAGDVEALGQRRLLPGGGPAPRVGGG